MSWIWTTVGLRFRIHFLFWILFDFILIYDILVLRWRSISVRCLTQPLNANWRPALWCQNSEIWGSAVWRHIDEPHPGKRLAPKKTFRTNLPRGLLIAGIIIGADELEAGWGLLNPCLQTILSRKKCDLDGRIETIFKVIPQINWHWVGGRASRGPEVAVLLKCDFWGVIILPLKRSTRLS